MEKEKTDGLLEKLSQNINVTVVKKDGTKEEYNVDKIKKAVKKAAERVSVEVADGDMQEICVDVPRVGEVSRCVVLERYDKVPFAQSLGTLVSERLVDTVMVALITFTAVVSQWQVFRTFVIEAGGVSEAGVFSSVGRVAILILSVVAIALVLYFILRKMSLWTRIKSFIAHFWEGFMSLSKMRHFWLFIIETVGIWFCYFMQFYLCFFCFDFSSDLSVAAALLLFVAGSVAVVVPTPNGAGPWHFAVISIMMLYGVSETNAGVFALIVHSLQTLLVALLGIVGILMLQFKR